MPAMPQKRPRAKKGEGDKLREQIIEAATDLLIETGNEDAVSIRGVAERVGVTPPSIYMHFADKNELIFAVCEKHFAVLDGLIEAAGAKASGLLEGLKLRGRAYIQFGLDHPEHDRVLFRSKPAAAPEGYQEERLMRSAAFNHLVEAVAAAVESGEIEGDPAVVAVGLWSAVHGITSLLISHPDFPWPDIESSIDHLLQVQLYGLVSRRA